MIVLHFKIEQIRSTFFLTIDKHIPETFQKSFFRGSPFSNTVVSY
jgi:hypothetical protein